MCRPGQTFLANYLELLPSSLDQESLKPRTEPLSLLLLYSYEL